MTDTRCTAPWVNADFDYKRGIRTIRPCCIYGVGMDNPNPVSTLEEWKVSEELADVREKLDNGIWPDRCWVCKRDETMGNESKRQEYNRLHPEKTPEIIAMKVRTGWDCNLKCTMCLPKSSKKVAEEYTELGETWTLTGREEYDVGARDEIEKQLPHIQYLDIQGGEPLMHKPTLSWLEDVVIAKGFAKNQTLRITTNGTVSTDRLRAIYSEFKQVNFSVSIDGIGKLDEYIRFPTKWEKILKTIEEAKPYCEVSVMPTLNILNMFGYDEIVDWSNQNGYEMGLTNVVDFPKCLHPSVLPEPLKAELAKTTKDAFVKEMCATPTDPEKLKEFVRYISARDRVRGNSILDVLPQFEPWFK